MSLSKRLQILKVLMGADLSFRQEELNFFLP